MTYNNKVIRLFKGWEFWDYVSPAGNNKIEEWRETDLSDEGKLVFDKLLHTIQRTENHLEWLGFKATIKRGNDRVWELAFFCDGRQYRVLGTFHGAKVAVLLIGCYHKTRVYHPTDAIDQAFKRKQLLVTGEASHYERKV